MGKTQRKTTQRSTPRKRKTTEQTLRSKILDHFRTLKIPLGDDEFDAAVGEAERDGLSHLQLLDRLLGRQAEERRQRSLERRIREARFAEVKTLQQFDWQFNAKTIDRSRIEELATGEFIRRGDNLIAVGQSGVGKSHIFQALGRKSCELEYRVRYTTSADLLADLSASLADGTTPRRIRYWAKFDLLIIDEFGFDRIERSRSPEASSLLYKIIDARSPARSTALITNIPFDAWGEYLQDIPLAMALLDRLVDRAVILQLEGKSYRAARAQTSKKAN
jgi:DNA replication protein DnaC